MELLLIWSCGLGSALLAVALAVAQAARWPRSSGTALVTVVCLALLLASLPLGLLLYLTGLARGGALLRIAVPAATLLGGALAIVALGRTSASPGLEARAASWSRGRLGAVLLAVVCILVTSARTAIVSARQTLETRRAELISLERLWWPGVPASLDAAPLYALARQKTVPLDAVPGAHAAFEQLWSAPLPSAAQLESPALAEWVARNGAALAFAVEGAQRPGYVGIDEALRQANPFGVGRQAKILKLERGRPGAAESPDDELGRRRLGDLLRTRSLLREHAGRLSLAMEDANAFLALMERTDAAGLHPGPFLERLLGAPGLTAAALAGLRFPPGEGLLVHLQRTLLRSEHESFDFLELFTTGQAKDTSSDPLDRPFMLGIGLCCAEAWSAEVERYYDEAWEALYAPPAQRLGRIRHVRTRLFEIVPGGIRSAQWLPRRFEARLRDEAERATAQAGVALARYRLAHGSWPERLEALVPEELAQIPSDPFDGAQLRYRPRPDGALVYSVGADLKDDGGAAGDVVFSVPTPR